MIRAPIAALGIAVSLGAALPAATAAAPARSPRTGWIDVSVATLWTNPAKPRAVDAPALANPVHLEAWLHAMSVAQRRALTDENATQTQALYGARVHILAERDGWYEVAVAGQPTPENRLGYPGWVPAVQVTRDPRFGELVRTRPFALIDRRATAILYRDRTLGQQRLRLSYDTRLPVLGRAARAVEVVLPGGGSGWLPGAAVTVFASAAAIPAPTGAELVRTARMFLGRPYLWGGASGFAMDCSGLTHMVYDAHGITIGRDADDQADFTGHGTRVSALAPGDILFYARDRDDPSTIYHDALYAGHGRMIEAYGAGVPVRITPVRFGTDYWGAERYLPVRER